MAYYAYYICNSPDVLPHFYSNEAPVFPGNYIEFTGGVDPDYIGNCYRVEIIDKQPLSWVIINWDDPLAPGYAQYTTFNDCTECTTQGVVQILENCDDGQDIICLQNTLVVDSVVIYNGKCYQVKEVPSCNATVPITYSPTQIFKDCPSCKQHLPQTNYALINCDTGDITYTSTDLSGYVNPPGQAITIDGSDACFQVEVVTDIPPGTPVTVTDSFASCELCGSDYYELVPCDPNSSLESIITYTDLSGYIGTVITLETCPDVCWEVRETLLNQGAQEVQVLANYDDCTECNIAIVPATCVTFTNTSEFASSFGYIDYQGSVQKITIAGKTSIEKVCALSWDINPSITVTQFGNCVNGECPVVPQPKRKVTPGYNTPVCSTEYYEKVECNFSEWMYKDVLEKRYGISNCCPEDLMKWEIKHEMLMLDILVNPDYTCASSNTCGCPQPCDCGYLSLTVSSSTCNSQTN